MGYYIRVLGSQDPDIHIDELIKSLAAEGLTAKFEYDPTEEPNKWTMLDILNANGEPLAQLERNPVFEGELGQEELEEFKEEIKDFKPASYPSDQYPIFYLACKFQFCPKIFLCKTRHQHACRSLR